MFHTNALIQLFVKKIFSKNHFSSVQFKVISMCSEKPIYASPRLSEVSPTLPLKQFHGKTKISTLLFLKLFFKRFILTCDASMHGSCHVWCWMNEFSEVVLSMFRAFLLNYFHGCIAQPNRKTRSAHWSRQFFI